jgi:hypothetical protein
VRLRLPTVSRPDLAGAAVDEAEHRLVTGLALPLKTVKLVSSNSSPAWSIECKATSASLNSVDASRTIGSQSPLMQ